MGVFSLMDPDTHYPIDSFQDSTKLSFFLLCYDYKKNSMIVQAIYKKLNLWWLHFIAGIFKWMHSHHPAGSQDKKT